jgi:thymidylate synthase
MREYHELVEEVISEGNFKQNRTGVATISKFGVDYTIDRDRFPLLTTKKMDGFRWDSMIHELFWYLDGEHHIRNLREKTGIWDEWADEDGHLDTAYGRFWRNYPVPVMGQKYDGESWDDTLYDSEWVRNDINRNPGFDQIQYVIDNLKENPNSRRHVVSAWHPANAANSTLPPCHYSFVFNVQNGNELNLHLTQRSGDIALGIPFNIACYSLLQRMIAQEVGLEVGKFHHSIVDAHIYCGVGERAHWWAESIKEYQDSMNPICKIYCEKEYIGGDTEDPENYDHIPGLVEQIDREQYILHEDNI